MSLPFVPTYHCAQTTDTVVIDGSLSESCWASAQAETLVAASSGTMTRPRTIVRACWNDTHLYIAFQCDDDDVWGSYDSHDDPIYDEEVVEVFISPERLARYVEIEISPRGVTFDAAIHSPDLDRQTMQTDLAWECVGMKARIQCNTVVHTTPPKDRDDHGPPGVWTAELAIPFASLGLTKPPVPGSEWRINFYRIDRGLRSSYQAWSPTLRRPADYHVPERFGILRFEDAHTVALHARRWSAAKARAWYRRQPWLVGCNFVPSSASNQLEMWQAATFDPETIDRELGWAASLGMNVVRVYLHDLAWQQDPSDLRIRMARYLTLAARHGIRTIFVLFDDCWNPDPKPGRQADPIPGVHNSRWLQSPGRAIVNDPREWDRLQSYVLDILGVFGQDRRILMWDLYNEPGNEGQAERSLPLLRKAFEWARTANPTQPLTAGVWFDHEILNQFQLAHSDIITFHNYKDAATLEQQIKDLHQCGRPLVCTEWMARPESAIPTHLSVFRRHRVGCLSWGLVSGKSQTIYPWGSPAGGPEPAVWFHDLLHPDGTPYSPAEIMILRQETNRPVSP